MSKKQYDLDDLPRFSRWPARLLGAEEWQPKSKTAAEVAREYEHEKWGPLLKIVRNAGRGMTVHDADKVVFADLSPQLCSVGRSFRMLTAMAAHRRHIDLVVSALERFQPCNALVELGAGYGTIILRLAKLPGFRRTPIIAGEFAPSGVGLIELLARAQKTNIVAGACDFASSPLVEFQIPEGALIYTSMATPCVPMLDGSFIDQLVAMQPKAVVHVEPCYEHCDTDTLLGSMRRRYIEINDYNRNLVTLLRKYQKQGALQIVAERRAVFGTNPLLCSSVIAWVPEKRRPARDRSKRRAR